MKLINAYQGKFLNILKLTLAVGTLGFIGYKLVYAYQIGDLWANLQLNFSATSICILVLILALMPLNWYIEIKKWKLIIQKHEPVSSAKAYKSVLTGITLGIITPNQIGDMAGKALYLETLPKVKGAVVTLLGEIAQTVATLMIGSYGAFALYVYLNPISTSLCVLGYILLTVINIGWAILFLNISLLQKIKKWDRLNQYLTLATNYSKPELLQLLIFSAIRFIIFTFQYYLLLYFFGVTLTPMQWAMSVFSIYIVQSFAPSFIIIQIGVRGALALYFIGLFTNNTVGILLSAYSLWIINIMIPGIIGLYFLLTHKWNSKS